MSDHLQKRLMPVPPPLPRRVGRPKHSTSIPHDQIPTKYMATYFRLYECRGYPPKLPDVAEKLGISERTFRRWLLVYRLKWPPMPRQFPGV